MWKSKFGEWCRYSIFLFFYFFYLGSSWFRASGIFTTTAADVLTPDIFTTKKSVDYSARAQVFYIYILYISDVTGAPKNII